jgi:hypothetical protein
MNTCRSGTIVLRGGGGRGERDRESEGGTERRRGKISLEKEEESRKIGLPQSSNRMGIKCSQGSRSQECKGTGAPHQII